MTDHELDSAYTALCLTMTRLGQANAPLYLARFALLAMTRLGGAALVNELLDAAAQDLRDEDPTANAA